MTTQIAVRIPDDLVAFLDETVRAEGVPGRATIVARALARERRRLIAEQDARIYAEHRDDVALEEFIDRAATTTPDID